MLDVIKWFVQLLRHDMQMFTLDKETDIEIFRKITEVKNKEAEKIDIHGSDKESSCR